MYSLVFALQPFDNGSRAIGRVVIHHNRPDAGPLAKNLPQKVFDGEGFVIRWHHGQGFHGDSSTWRVIFPRERFPAKTRPIPREVSTKKVRACRIIAYPKAASRLTCKFLTTR